MPKARQQGGKTADTASGDELLPKELPKQPVVVIKPLPALAPLAPALAPLAPAQSQAPVSPISSGNRVSTAPGQAVTAEQIAISASSNLTAANPAQPGTPIQEAPPLAQQVEQAPVEDSDPSLSPPPSPVKLNPGVKRKAAVQKIEPAKPTKQDCASKEECCGQSEATCEGAGEPFIAPEQAETQNHPDTVKTQLLIICSKNLKSLIVVLKI